MGLLVAAYVVRSLWAREQKEPVMAIRNMPTPVVDIPVGTEITEKHLGTAPIRTDELTADMLANKNIIIGRVAREPLKKAVPIKANQLYAPGERPKLELAKGKQALTLPFDSVTTIVDGLIRPGDHCDIRYTLNPSWIRSDQRTSQAFQMTLFKAIKVIAINRNVVQQQPESTGNTVTLEVSSKQANALLLAKTYGTLNLTYTEDLTPGGIVIADADTDRLTLEKLLGLPEKKEPAAPPRPPEPYRIDEYRGLRRTTVNYNRNGRIWDGFNNWGNGARTDFNPNLYIPGAGADPTYSSPVPGGGPNLGGPGGPGANNTAPGNSVPGSNLPGSNVPGNNVPGNNPAGNSVTNSNGNGNPSAANAGPNNNGSGNNPQNAANPGDFAPPTQMAAQSQYAHQPVNTAQNFDSAQPGPQSGPYGQTGLAGNGQQQSGPQFYGQSAPGQVTGPGYTIAPQVSPGLYGNVPYYRVP
ncbi:MAG: Flp pilus assembly protein CpaB [Planctomycetaceae bacterium]|nr:Flp pilus assembly protein CpaB [Planctomycetaceae bacterium]